MACLHEARRISGRKSTKLMSTQYDQSGKWPVTADGWQVFYVDDTMFSGGPLACKVISPECDFFFGINFEPPSQPKTAVVTSFGMSSTGRPKHQMLVTPAARSTAEAKVREYLLANSQLFFPRSFSEVEFRAGDGRLVEVF